MKTRLRFKLIGEKYVAGPFQGGNKVYNVSIHNDGLSFTITQDGQMFHYLTDNMNEAKKQSKQMLLDSGVIFQSEVRKKLIKTEVVL